MAQWHTHKTDFVADSARIRVAKNLGKMHEHDGRWIAVANAVSGLSERDLQQNVACAGDNVLLATLIDICRRAIQSDNSVMLLSEGLPSPILNTHPRLQHEFCTLWNELVQEAGNQGSFSTPVQILRMIRQHYILLHQGTDAAPTAFSSSTDDVDELLYQPFSFPLCTVASHRPDSTSPGPVPVPDRLDDSLPTQPGDTPVASSRFAFGTSRQAKEASINSELPLPSDPTTPSKIGDHSQPPAAAEQVLPVHVSLHPTDAPPPSAALQDTPSSAVLSYALQGTT
jgi:hypothetical protein